MTLYTIFSCSFLFYLSFLDFRFGFYDFDPPLFLQRAESTVCSLIFSLFCRCCFVLVFYTLATILYFFNFYYVYWIVVFIFLIFSLQSFDYTELCQPGTLLDNNGAIPVSVNSIQRAGTVSVHGGQNSPTTSLGGTSANGTTRSRPWHDFGRQNDADKIQIPKM